MCKHILFNNFNPELDLETLKDFTARTYDNDGFGAILRTNSGEIYTLKSLDLGSFYIELMKTLYKLPISTLVVHHRTSTNEKGLNYAHPFEYKGFFLTHNGVVDVPGDYKTKTKNDSEKLLHHLLETGFDTGSIRGYFSCFMLSKEKTIVLVDNTAPIYSKNSRVFSSHKLGEDFEKIECKKLTLNPSGQLESIEPIPVTESSYGSNLAHLSLGNEVYDYYSPNYADDYGETITQNVSSFFDLMTPEEETSLARIRSPHKRMKRIDAIAWSLGISLTEREMETIQSFYRE